MPALNPTAPAPSFNTQLHFLLGRGHAPSVEAAAYPARAASTGESVFLRLRAEHADGVEATVSLSSDDRADLADLVRSMAAALATLPPTNQPDRKDQEGER